MITLRCHLDAEEPCPCQVHHVIRSIRYMLKHPRSYMSICDQNKFVANKFARAAVPLKHMRTLCLPQGWSTDRTAHSEYSIAVGAQPCPLPRISGLAVRSLVILLAPASDAARPAAHGHQLLCRPRGGCPPIWFESRFIYVRWRSLSYGRFPCVMGASLCVPTFMPILQKSMSAERKVRWGWQQADPGNNSQP